MFSRVRIAIRFFFMGLAVGILLAPRSGAQTRQLVRAKADQLLNDVLDATTLGTADDGPPRAASRGAGGTDATEDSADDGEPTPRSRNGRGRSRAASAAQA